MSMFEDRGGYGVGVASRSPDRADCTDSAAVITQKAAREKLADSTRRIARKRPLHSA